MPSGLNWLLLAERDRVKTNNPAEMFELSVECSEADHAFHATIIQIDKVGSYLPIWHCSPDHVPRLFCRTGTVVGIV